MSEPPSAPPASWALVITANDVLRVRAFEGLTSSGLQCEAAATAARGLEWLEAARHPYRILVLDLDCADPPPHEVLAIAVVAAPQAGVIACGPAGGLPASPGTIRLSMPALASEFARAAARLASQRRDDLVAT